jgi:hypothetical protein
MNINTKLKNQFDKTLRPIGSLPYSSYFETLGILKDETNGVVELMHGTSMKSKENIFLQGINPSREHGALGRAIYLTDNTMKALNYSKCSKCKNGPYCQGHGSEDKYFVILICEVNLGNIYESDDHLSHLTSPPDFKDSVWGKSATLTGNNPSTFLFNEFGLYDSKRVYPKYAVYIEKMKESDWIENIHWAFKGNQIWKPFSFNFQRELDKNSNNEILKFKFDKYTYDLEKMVQLGPEQQEREIVKVQKVWSFIQQTVFWNITEIKTQPLSR